MAILKKTRNGGVFRNPNTGEDNTSRESTNNKDKISKKEIIIEGMAEDLSEGKKKKRKNKLDTYSQKIPISVTPRIEARWRYLANIEDRNMSSFIRRAVAFYIEEHELN